MRDTFSKEINRYASKNDKIYIVAADITPAGKLIEFRKKNPDRFINVGVSEQSMIALAAGLAMRGKKVFAYTIATFALFRPFEMIRVDLCYQNLPVVIVGMGAGTIYSSLGATHLSQEDISIARSLPNMQIIAPCDPNELKKVIKYLIYRKTKNPIYLRIGKSGEKDYTSKVKEDWKFGKLRKIKEGKKICFLTFGPIIEICFEIRNQMLKKNINIAIYNAHTLKPFDENSLKKIFKSFKKIVVIEDHSEIGGLASIVKSLAFKYNFKGKILSYSLKDKFFHEYSSQKNLLKLHEIYSKKVISDLIK